jgi:hypothetical protein
MYGIDLAVDRSYCYEHDSEVSGTINGGEIIEEL